MVKILKKTSFKDFYETNEYVAHTSPMMTHYHSSNPLERWLWKQKKKIISDLLAKKSIKNIIDLGCGDAGMLEVIGNTIHYRGIDISPTQISYAKNTIKKLKRKDAEVGIGDVLNTKLKSHSFDAALLCDVVEHVLSPEKLFQEAQRIVKKKGYIIISIPNEWAWEVIRASLLRFPLRSPDHINAISPNDIKRFFPSVEFETHVPVSQIPSLSLIHIFLIKNDK